MGHTRLCLPSRFHATNPQCPLWKRRVVWSDLGSEREQTWRGFLPTDLSCTCAARWIFPCSVISLRRCKYSVPNMQSRIPAGHRSEQERHTSSQAFRARKRICRYFQFARRVANFSTEGARFLNSFSREQGRKIWYSRALWRTEVKAFLHPIIKIKSQSHTRSSQAYRFCSTNWEINGKTV